MRLVCWIVSQVNEKSSVAAEYLVLIGGTMRGRYPCASCLTGDRLRADDGCNKRKSPLIERPQHLIH